MNWRVMKSVSRMFAEWSATSLFRNKQAASRERLLSGVLRLTAAVCAVIAPWLIFVAHVPRKQALVLVGALAILLLANAASRLPFNIRMLAFWVATYATVVISVLLGGFVPIALLGFALITVMTTLVMGRKSGLVATVVSSVTLIGIALLHRSGIVIRNANWADSVDDVHGQAVVRVVLIFTLELLAIVVAVSYLLTQTEELAIEKSVALDALQREIEEHKRTEVTLRERGTFLDKIINNLGDPLFVKDELGRMVVANDAFCALFNLPRDKILGETLAEQTPLEEREHFAIIDKQVLKEGLDSVCEEPLTIRGGPTHTISTRKTRYQDSNGNKYIIGVIHDVTERQQLEAQFRQAQKMEAIGTLAGGIAHDFNNILTAIRGFTQLAKADSQDRPDLQIYLDTVLQGADRAAELVKQIITFSRNQTPQLRPVLLQRMVTEVHVLLRGTIPATIEIRLALDNHAPAVLADASQIHQIIMNLCTNAWHAMKDKSGVLSISVKPVDLDEVFAKRHPGLHAGTHIQLSIADTGTGMDAVTLNRIFEPFFTTKAPGEGSGLGLAVVDGIIRNHHGAIVVRSELNLGTTFHLYFPVHANDQFE